MSFLFYCPDIATSPVLPESDSAHAVRVLRLGEGARLQVTDGAGSIYDCVLTGAHPKHAALEVVERHAAPLPWQGEITVAVAPTKSMDRMEWLVEKLTEIGVNRIVPLLCERSERREIKRERLEKIAVSAMKQSLKAVLPRIDEMTTPGRLLETIPGEVDCYMGYCDATTERIDLALAAVPGRDTLVMIGPEGDFTPGEVEMLRGAGVRAVTLGPSRLRTETAALDAVMTLHVLERMRR